MSVDPGIADLLFVYLSCREVGLSDAAVDGVSVDVCIIESVVLTDRLCLVVEVLDRLIVIDPDVADRIFIVLDGLACDGVISAVRSDSYVVDSVCVSCVLDVVLEVLGLLVDLVRADYQGLYEVACTYAESIDEYHDHRHLEELGDLALLNVYSQCDRADD